MATTSVPRLDTRLRGGKRRAIDGAKCGASDFVPWLDDNLLQRESPL